MGQALIGVSHKKRFINLIIQPLFAESLLIYEI